MEYIAYGITTLFFGWVVYQITQLIILFFKNNNGKN